MKNITQIENQKNTKICCRCKKELPLENFFKRKTAQDGLQSFCKSCDRKRCNEIKKKYPWMDLYKDIGKRCHNTDNKSYKWYGFKGIKRIITAKEIKELWFRDKAYLMKKPSLDRINANDHYRFNNCRFIEHSLNASLSANERWRKYKEKKNVQGLF